MNIPVYILKADGGTILIDQSLSMPGRPSIQDRQPALWEYWLQPALRKMPLLWISAEQQPTFLFSRTEFLFWKLSGVTIGGRKTLIRGLYTKSIGIGGDSAVRIKNGEISVGPTGKARRRPWTEHFLLPPTP